MTKNLIDATAQFAARRAEGVGTDGTHKASIIEFPLEKRVHHKGALDGIVDTLLILLDRGGDGTANCIELTELYNEQLHNGLQAHEILDILLVCVALLDEEVYEAYVPNYHIAFASLL